MKTTNTLQSLFKKLDKVESNIFQYQNILSRASYPSVKKELTEAMSVKILLESSITRVTDLVSVEVELVNTETELSKLKYAVANGVMIDFDVMHEAKGKIEKLKEEINEGL